MQQNATARSSDSISWMPLSGFLVLYKISCDFFKTEKHSFSDVLNMPWQFPQQVNKPRLGISRRKNQP
jgi:hypothetical protein